MNRLLLAILVWPLASMAFADSTKKELEANYAAITAAFKKRDINGISKFISPGFVANVDHGIKMKKPQILADFQTQMKIVNNVTWVRTVQKTTRKGDVVTATVDGLMNGDVVWMDKKSHKFMLQASAIDAWTKKSGKWVLLSTTSVKHNMFMDGKLMKPPASN